MANRWPSLKPFEFLQRIKFGGIVGKKTAITISVLIVLGVSVAGISGIGARIRIDSILALAMILGVIVIVAIIAVVVLRIAFRSIDNTVQHNPYLAIMDEVEFAKHKRFELELAAKDTPQLPAESAILDPTAPVIDLKAPPEDDEP
jgi:hypothetical protein